MPILLKFREKVGAIGHAVPVVLLFVLIGKFDRCEVHQNTVAVLAFGIYVFLKEDCLLRSDVSDWSLDQGFDPFILDIDQAQGLIA